MDYLYGVVSVLAAEFLALLIIACSGGKKK